MTATTVIVFGPNLNDQSKGQFHVHAADCGDCKHYGPGKKFGGEPGWKIEAESCLAVTEAVYGDHLSDYGLTSDSAEGKQMLRDWTSDLHFAPCVTLPAEESPVIPEAAQVALGELGEALLKDGEAKDAAILRAMDILAGRVRV